MDKNEITIEIPKGSINKWEVCKKSGKIKLDRVLFSSVVYPENYGYIDETLAEDNDPLDAFVLSTFPLIPGCLVDGRLIGGIEMIDGGERDTKLIYVVDRDPRLNGINDLKDVQEHKLLEIRHFLATYKQLQKKEVIVKEWLSKEECHKLLLECKERYTINCK